MLDLNQMSVFIMVVQEGSFTGAARTLSIPKSRVSRMVTDLESKLDVRLLERTTREVRTTDIGLQYYEQYKPLFEEISDIHSRISDNSSQPSGRLRISAPVGFALNIMGRWTSEFKQLYPEIDLEMIFSDTQVNLIRDGFDLGFAIGELKDSSLIARKFDETDPILCASPAFIKEYGPFTHPEQLNNVPWVQVNGANGFTHNATFAHKTTGETININQNDSVLTNHHEVAVNHILAGQGVSISSAFFTYEQLIRGELEVVLPEWVVQQEPLYMIFPSGKHQAKKVRAFIDYFIEKAEQINTLMEQCSHLPEDEQVKKLKQYLSSDATVHPKLRDQS